MSKTLSRRGLVAAAPAAIVADTLPALPAGTHPDAALLALHEPWLATLAAFDAALTAKSKIDEQVFTQTEHYPTLETWAGSYADFSATCAAITAEREAIGASLGIEEADELEESTSDANAAVVEQIEAIPARTLTGIAFKVRVSEDECHNRPELIESIMADIKALAAGGLDA